MFHSAFTRGLEVSTIGSKSLQGRDIIVGRGFLWIRTLESPSPISNSPALWALGQLFKLAELCLPSLKSEVYNTHLTGFLINIKWEMSLLLDLSIFQFLVQAPSPLQNLPWCAQERTPTIYWEVMRLPFCVQHDLHALYRWTLGIERQGERLWKKGREKETWSTRSGGEGWREKGKVRRNLGQDVCLF